MLLGIHISSYVYILYFLHLFISNFYQNINVEFYFAVYPPMPCTMAPEHQSKMLETMIHLRVDPVTGLTSKYDYANNRWKE